MFFLVGHHMGLTDEDKPFSLSAYDAVCFQTKNQDAWSDGWAISQS